MTPSLQGVLMFDDQTAALVIAARTGVSASTLSLDPDTHLGSATAEYAAKHGLRVPSGITLGLPSTHCLAATVERSGLLRAEREQAMRYRLEEAFPLDAEDLTATFTPIDRTTSLGVAAESRYAQSLIDGFESAGIDIGPIAPTAMLAIDQAKLPTLDAPDGPCVARLDQPGGGVDLIALRSRTPIAWRHIPSGDPAATQQALTSLPRPSSTTPVTDSESDQPAKDNSAEPETSIAHLQQDAFIVAAAQGACSATRRTRAGLFDLRHGPLARRNRVDTLRPAWLAAGLAACVMLGSILGVSLWRASANQAALDAVRDAEIAAFADVYPGQPAPLSIAARFRSELAALQSQRAPTDLDTQPPALPTLASVLAATPRDLRIQLDEIRIDGQRIVIDGAARSHAQAAQLGRAISTNSVADLEPPYTENLPDRGVGFTLTGEVQPTSTTANADRLAADGRTTPEPEGGL